MEANTRFDNMRKNMLIGGQFFDRRLTLASLRLSQLKPLFNLLYGYLKGFGYIGNRVP